MAPVNCIVKRRWYQWDALYRKKRCVKVNCIDMEAQKWFNTCTIMSLGVTKANGWLHRDTYSMMVQVKHYTNRVNLNEI